MTRLDSVIRRLQAQRACLNFAAEQVEGRSGVVFEIGLGNGRTYDHLRSLLPDQEIFVFDRQVAAHPSCIPDAAHMIRGDIQQTLPAMVERMAGRCVLVHIDIGSGVEARDRRVMAEICAALPGVLAPGALVISDQPLSLPGCVALPLPEEVEPGRYHILQQVAEVGGAG